jgi:hypothetical protein
MANQVKNLILVHNPVRQSVKDFEEIGDRIASLRKDIAPVIVSIATLAEAVPVALWSHPTLTVSFGPLGHFVPRRGIVMRNQRLEKTRELELLEQHGVPVPRWQTYVPGLDLDPALWGPLVIVKPALPEFRGVTLLPTSAVKSFNPQDYPEDHAYRNSLLIVQQFVDTGIYPAATRVLTLFGEPLHCMKSTLKQARPALDAVEELGNAVVATDQKGEDSYFNLRNLELVNDEGAIAIARAAHKAFPGLPLLGCDIVHDQRDNRTYILEVNSRGATWHFSSRYAQPSLASISRQERIDQFGAWDIAARVLIEKTLQYAR